MKSVNIHEAKTQLSRLIQRAVAGEEIVIVKVVKPLVKLVPCTESTEPRQPGRWRGRVRIAEDFDRLPDDIVAAFHGEAKCSLAIQRK